MYQKIKLKLKHVKIWQIVRKNTIDLRWSLSRSEWKKYWSQKLNFTHDDIVNILVYCFCFCFVYVVYILYHSDIFDI